ncbi:DUF3533 domain-containing protein [Nakamurella sp. YIM 132087]|uniref:DUF3533 domain-containing protein n=1 Tax=Nakamurella alba TaxID=2665158 RepID=A0A7K1FPF1_9ACTN|nr:DUF3533 domain-containing protein [Nakamurella alba]MTD15219.1 DUF3533 domain-containing protein [Nakamurella alba]
MTESARGRHESPEEPAGPGPGFWTELKDAVSLRTVSLVIGVLLLQLGFVLSYVGAFHEPTPHEIGVTVVGPAQVAEQLSALPGTPLTATATTDEAVARAALTDGSTNAVLVVSGSGTQDTLLVASAGGASKATAIQSVITQAEAAQSRTVTVDDVLPTQPGDNRGLTGFYLVIGWTVGGYLVASLLGVAKGARPANPRRAVIRLASVVPYAILSGLGGAIVVGPVLGALTGHTMALWWLGALIVFAAAAVTMAFQVLLGVLGIGLTVLVFVILGNPSAGGAYALELLPTFWRVIGGAIPNGAGTAAVRKIVYFGAEGVGGNLLVIGIWAVAGALVALGASTLMHRRAAGKPSPEGVLV